MIKLNYQTQRSEVSDCMMGVIENTALYYQLDYAYLYHGIWVFRFDKENNEGAPFWKRLSTPELINSHKQIELYHGLAIQKQEITTFEDFRCVLKEELSNGNPVAVCVNAYYCPWSGVYQKYPLLHFCSLVAYDEDKDEVMCADPYFMRDIRPWPMQMLKAGLYHYYLFRVVKPVKDLSDWRKDVLLCAQDKIENHAFEQMIDMKDEILHDKNFLEELRMQNDQYSFELFYQMKYIGHSRYNHAEFLRYVAARIPAPQGTELTISAEHLEQASILWKKAGLLFTKLAYLNNHRNIQKSITGIAERMDECIHLERMAAERIIHITEDET